MAPGPGAHQLRPLLGPELADLLAEPGVVETVRLGLAFGFMAFHGGRVAATDTIAAAAARAWLDGR